MKIRKTRWVEEEIESFDFPLPTETEYFFQTGIRRAVRIIPIFTTWKHEKGLPEEVYKFSMTFVYSSFECKVEQFTIDAYFLSERYHSTKDSYNIIRDWINGDLLYRTKEQFEADLNKALNILKSGIE